MSLEIPKVTQPLFLKAPENVNTYFLKAVELIDTQFGIGYAKEHPELIATFISTCAQDYHTAIIAQSNYEFCEDFKYKADHFLMAFNEWLNKD